jgi:hypothetical protein
LGGCCVCPFPDGFIPALAEDIAPPHDLSIWCFGYSEIK